MLDFLSRIAIISVLTLSTLLSRWTILRIQKPIPKSTSKNKCTSEPKTATDLDWGTAGADDWGVDSADDWGTDSTTMATDGLGSECINTAAETSSDAHLADSPTAPASAPQTCIDDDIGELLSSVEGLTVSGATGKGGDAYDPNYISVVEDKSLATSDGSLGNKEQQLLEMYERDAERLEQQ